MSDELRRIIQLSEAEAARTPEQALAEARDLARRFTGVITTPPTVRKGIAYWPTVEAALAVRDRVHAQHPNARVVIFEPGWAVQVERGGAYLDAEGRVCA